MNHPPFETTDLEDMVRWAEQKATTLPGEFGELTRDCFFDQLLKWGVQNPHIAWRWSMARAWRTLRRRPQSTSLPVDPHDLSTSGLDPEVAAVLARAVARLPPMYRSVVEAFLDGREADKLRLFRARQRLREDACLRRLVCDASGDYHA